MVDTFREALAELPANYRMSGNEVVGLAIDPTGDAGARLSHLRGDAGADGVSSRYRVANSAEAMALEADLQALPRMNEKAFVSVPALTVAANRIDGGGHVFSGSAGSGIADDSEVYNDEYIALRETPGGTFTNWYRVRRVKTDSQAISPNNEYVYCYEDLPAGSYDGYKVGTLIWREVLFAANEYNLDGFRCIPGLVLAGEEGARIVEVQAGLQHPFRNVSENIFTDLTLYPNQSWDALDGTFGPIDNPWGGIRCYIERCKIRQGGMGNDHSGGPLSIPIFDGGLTTIRDCDIRTSRYMVGWRSAVGTISKPIYNTTLFLDTTTFERVGDMIDDDNMLYPSQLHLPPNCRTIAKACDFAWGEMYHDNRGPAPQPWLASVHAGDMPLVAPPNDTSQNAYGLFLNCQWQHRGIDYQVPNSGERLRTSCIRNDEPTATIQIVGGLLEHQMDTLIASVPAIQAVGGSNTILDGVTINSDSGGITVSGNATVEILGGTNISVDSPDVNASCLIAVTTSGVLKFSNCRLQGLNGARSLNALLAVVDIGNNVEFLGPVNSVSNTTSFPFRGQFTLAGTGGLQTITVPVAANFNEFQAIACTRIATGGTRGHLTVVESSRDHTAGTFQVEYEAGDTSTFEYRLHT